MTHGNGGITLSEYRDRFIEESNYLDNTVNLIQNKLNYESTRLTNKKSELIQSRRDMWENTTHSSNDFDKLTEANQYLSALQNQTLSYSDSAKLVARYEKMIDSPYFARIDFIEDGYDDTEKIYIGLFNLMDDESHEIIVYDWRAPISSVFYRFEPGPVEYTAPAGKIRGNMSLKRQYKIKNGKLEYFFDSNINILDDMLKEALSKNISSRMKTIVETIQKQQDVIIRDLINELLIVQGVAGSGKTSVALHRIAFLLYQGLNLKLKSNNIVIISPNSLFSRYISNVLPDLGEENIAELTFENIFSDMFENRFSVKTKGEQLEEIICAPDRKTEEFLRSYMEFKGSRIFATILDRYKDYFEHRMIVFEDVYFNNKYIGDKHLMKSLLLSSKLNMPTAKKLKIIESRILDRMKDMKNERREKIEEAVNRSTTHQFEIKAFTRLLAAKETAFMTEKIRKFTEFDCFELYKQLFANRKLFHKLAKGLTLPENIDEIIDYTCNNLDPYNLPYADGLCLIYLKMKTKGCDLYTSIKQVMVDEAQDYYPIHYMILNNLFREARFTIVGDVNQSIEKQADLSIYDDIAAIVSRNKSAQVSLNKSYRSSYEISRFCKKLQDSGIDTEFFKRNESEPEVVKSADRDDMDNKIIERMTAYRNEGFNSIAVICKSRKQASELYFRIRSRIEVKFIDNLEHDNISGISIVPVYMAKGLEFDAVIVYGADDADYNTEYDKKLLYVACTRPLHKLSVYYSGELSRYLK